MAGATIEIYEQSDIETFGEYTSQIDNWSIGLWFDDFESAGINQCYVAFDGDLPIGYQTINGDGFCTAIEVHSDYRGKGIAGMLVEESGCFRPDRNENPEFWAAMEDKFGC